MHPDQATEAIVDTALRLNVPFAVLPCCVMPSLFPNRRKKGRNGKVGDPVRSYSRFCEYLLDKAPEGESFHVDHLPFVGRNKVIFGNMHRTRTLGSRGATCREEGEIGIRNSKTLEAESEEGRQEVHCRA
jgi:hypothetical protein